MLRGVGGDLLVLSLDVAADDDGEHPRAAGDTGAWGQCSREAGGRLRRHWTEVPRAERALHAGHSDTVCGIHSVQPFGWMLSDSYYTAKESSEGGNFMTNVASYCLG